MRDFGFPSRSSRLLPLRHTQQRQIQVYMVRWAMYLPRTVSQVCCVQMPKTSYWRGKYWHWPFKLYINYYIIATQHINLHLFNIQIWGELGNIIFSCQFLFYLLHLFIVVEKIGSVGGEKPYRLKRELVSIFGVI